jgi:hypothetical protein
MNDTQHVFLGKITGGQEITSGDETSKLKWFKNCKFGVFNNFKH